MGTLTSFVRISLGLAWLGGCVFTYGLVLVPLLPWRALRVRVSNHFGTTVGRTLVFLAGCPVTVKGRAEAVAARPAIYASNHSSILDIFLAIWLTPYGTVGTGKKSVIWYPFFGLFYVLSGHLRLDRSDPESAVRSMEALVPFVKAKGLSIMIWPEGRRSRDGHLRPLKKGIAHLAMQTGLPIVPLVVKGAHKGWESKRLAIVPTPIEVEFLPAVDTSSWTVDTIDQHLADLHQRFADALPEDQKPLEPLEVAEIAAAAA